MEHRGQGFSGSGKPIRRNKTRITHVTCHAGKDTQVLILDEDDGVVYVDVDIRGSGKGRDNDILQHCT